MKHSIRFLLTVPFILVTFFYLHISLDDDGCSGLMDLFFGALFITLFAVSIWLAFRAIYPKRELNKRIPEPISLTITLLTLAILIVGKIFGQDFKGSTWIYAEANTGKLETQALTLRENGTFKVELGHVDFSCYFSGHYQTHGDTVVLDKDVIAQTNSLLTVTYLLRDTLIIPIKGSDKDSSKFSEFVIQSKE
ncbi:hypothetical protein [Limnovirga soli]|uniref:Uncharacterized protein n=1 Tax=Limnovirga soli TaxID=2656915 RepID=A0A8J8JUY9_9BACT|nr:hypothetical protein [Limnovirga soli]NNV57543.1 hypothetical protein [Limnovirga soli]